MMEIGEFGKMLWIFNPVIRLKASFDVILYNQIKVWFGLLWRISFWISSSNVKFRHWLFKAWPQSLDECILLEIVV